MNYPSKRNVFNLLILLLLTGTLIALIGTATKDREDGILLHFFDVGQGDATLIETPQNQKILIDGGPNDSVVSKLDKRIPFYQKRLDVVILTHPHADHLAGLIKVLDSFKVKEVYLTGVIYTTPEYFRFLEVIKEKNITTHAVFDGDYLDFGDGIKLNFLFPQKSLQGQKVDNLNNSSIVAKLTWGEKSALFTGDLEKEAQLQLLNSGIKAELLKISHHCSNDAVSETFLKKVDPKYSIIFVGKDNMFGHPTASCLNALKSTEVFRTDYNGDINFLMTKEKISHLN
ncbi:MAG: MBL fold metallo-hydrolase [Patescibacteria group bacterium]|jgi:competence protein ComEC|nr:MBL fold metallo-hydrolase [Patescibacteria group bacterium]